MMRMTKRDRNWNHSKAKRNRGAPIYTKQPVYILLTKFIPTPLGGQEVAEKREVATPKITEVSKRDEAGGTYKVGGER